MNAQDKEMLRLLTEVEYNLQVLSEPRLFLQLMRDLHFDPRDHGRNQLEGLIEHANELASACRKLQQKVEE